MCATGGSTWTARWPRSCTASRTSTLLNVRQTLAVAAKDQTQVEDKAEQGGQISRVDTRAHKHLLEERDLGALLVEVRDLLLAANHLTREVEDKDLKRQAGVG